MSAALDAAGAADLEEAEAKALFRETLEARLREAKAALTTETAGDAEIGLEKGLQALDDYVAALRGTIAAETARLGLASLPTTGEAEAARAGAADAAENAADVLAKARAALAGPEAVRARCLDSRASAAAACDSARGNLARLRREAYAALELEDDATLAGRLAKLAAAATEASEVLARLEGSRPSETMEVMNARITRLEGAEGNRTKIIRDLKQDIAVIASRVAREEGAGIEEQVASAIEAGEALRRERDTLRHEADVLVLLRDTLDEAERGARERYVQPIVRRITPYLQGLFPGVEVSCGDRLQVTGLTRGHGHEDIDNLSDGTREQVAVLLRLAYADLLAERGKPAMLILDDALAHSDHERLEQMFDVLTRAAQRMQILVLTCRSAAFGRLGGNRVRLVPASPVDQWAC